METNTQVVMSKLALAPVMSLVEAWVRDVYNDYYVDMSEKDFTDELCIMSHNWIVEAKIPVDTNGINLALRECVALMLEKYNAEEIERNRYDDEGHHFTSIYSDE